ncbi:LysM peptidoglycan-binding domain-containing protein [Bacillus lacus]|uniref:LysM peptidoglycan-binding domain-containing protein n=1 Tax=Metabacillus lacus TaxID=1983721 RepID=A0A7X2LZH6_9BACI|nr:peptidoglycan endopeptidase [Metabacillus lacus]MRX72923.1 LysM peptidoglycan-binding domain-containing protein [Metabacillus lacus]
MAKKIMGLSATAIVGSALFATAALADEVEVKKGDSLWKLSQEYNTTVQAIKQVNHLSGDTIFAGQVLQIPGGSRVTAQPATVSPASSAGASAEKVYTVQAGDSLWLIARNNGTSVNDIKSLNQLSGDMILIGQKLKLSSVQQPPASSNAPQAPVPQPLQNTAPVQNTGQSQTTYTVKLGDSLWSIANGNGITISELKLVNNLKSDVIYPGQVLTITGGTVKNISTSPSTAPVTSPPPVNSAVSSKVDIMVAEATSLIGVPYRWAGNTPAGFDCSGFVYYIMNKVTSISRLSAAGYHSVMSSVSEPARGDFVFFTTYQAGPSHMGLYLGNGEFIHASGSAGITISSLNNSYWKQRYLGAKRYF